MDSLDLISFRTFNFWPPRPENQYPNLVFGHKNTMSTIAVLRVTLVLDISPANELSTCVLCSTL